MTDLEQLTELRIMVERIQSQLDRLQSNAESEKGTLKRQGEMLRHEIKLVADKWDEIMFDIDKGLMIRIDRLMQDNERRKAMQKQIVALWIVVIGGIVKEVISWISSR